MTTVSNAALQRIAHANWLRDEAAHIRRLAAGAIPFAVAQDLDRLAAEYEREAAAIEDDVRIG
jgi:hypothetical protein